MVLVLRIKIFPRQTLWDIHLCPIIDADGTMVGVGVLFQRETCPHCTEVQRKAKKKVEKEKILDDEIIRFRRPKRENAKRSDLYCFQELYEKRSSPLDGLSGLSSLGLEYREESSDGPWGIGHSGQIGHNQECSIPCPPLGVSAHAPRSHAWGCGGTLHPFGHKIRLMNTMACTTKSRSSQLRHRWTEQEVKQGYQGDLLPVM